MQDLYDFFLGWTDSVSLGGKLALILLVFVMIGTQFVLGFDFSIDKLAGKLHKSKSNTEDGIQGEGVDQERVE